MGGGSGDECVGKALPIMVVVVAWRARPPSPVEGGSVTG